MGNRLVVFASGTPQDGGSGFEKLVEAARKGSLSADITAVVSNNENGGVREKADRLKIPFVHFSAPWTKERYQEILQGIEFDFIALSGWLKLVSGLDPRITFNIHPGPLPDFGGPGMYGHHVHEAVLEYGARVSGCTVHFVDNQYDHGPIILQKVVPVLEDDTPDTLAARVFQAECEAYPEALRLLASGKVTVDGRRVKVR